MRTKWAVASQLHLGKPFVVLSLFIALGSPATVRADIELTVTRVGFPSLTGPIVRNGAWTPVVVDLSLLGAREGFDGVLRIAQSDNDGDAQPVQVRCFQELLALRRETADDRVPKLFIASECWFPEGSQLVQELLLAKALLPVISACPLSWA